MPVKSQEVQAKSTVFHGRELLVRQLTHQVNFNLGSLEEFGAIAPRKMSDVTLLRDIVDNHRDAFTPPT